MDGIIAFTTAFTVIAIAELGDKTQILTIVLASKYKRLPVLVSVMVALSLLSLVAVLAGAVIFKYIPQYIVRIIATIVFILFAIWTFIEMKKSEKEKICDDEGMKLKNTLRIFAYCFCMIFIAEFGDKTQLTTIVLVSNLNEPVMIFLGAILAFFVVDAPAVYLGKKIAEKISIRYIKIASGLLFLVIGIFYILEIIHVI